MLLDRKWRDWDVILAIPAGVSVPAQSIEWLRVPAQQEGLPLVFHERVVTDGEFSGVRARAFGSPRFAAAVKYSVGPEDIVKM